MNRRSFLRIGGCAGLLNTLPWFHAMGEARLPATVQPAGGKKCILVWLDGGPSHLEMFDPKPEAAEEVRGPFSAIRTAIPGIRFSEILPRLAARANQLSLIRSMTSPLGEHNLGTHYLLTGFKPTPAIDYPAFGTVVTHLRNNKQSLPSNVAVPDHRVGGSQFSPAGFLGSQSRPFEVGGDPSAKDFRVRDLDWFPSLDEKRIRRREELLGGIEDLVENKRARPDAEFEQAFRLLTSGPAKAAFDVQSEPQETRQRYGLKSIGQCCLMARRLVERGVSFVTVNNRGWDTHDRMVTRLKDGYDGARVPVGLVPSLDMALSALLDDRGDRGLLQETLVVVMGEFGRTPKLNVNAGRDHWPRVFSVLLAGGGIRPGVIYGSSDLQGESPKENPVTPSQLVATLYQALGIDPNGKLQSPDGRPIRLANGALPIEGLF